MKEIVLEKLSALGVLADKEAIHEILKTGEPLKFCEMLEGQLEERDITVLTKEILLAIIDEKKVDTRELELWKASEERGEEVKTFEETNRKTMEKPAKDIHLSVKILKNYEQSNARADIANFISYFNDRYDKLKQRLQKRLTDLVSISHLKPKSKASIIGMVRDKRVTKNGHLILELEDQTGSVPVLFMKTKPTLFRRAEEVIPDEVIGISGSAGEGILFADDIVWPEVPLNREPKEMSDPVAVVFLSDTHIGSAKFLEQEFMRFIDWLNGKTGNKTQRELARRVGYILIAGDLVDGIGIYPRQEEELKILDIYEQFEKAAELLSLIPDYLKIVISPGNHDAVRLAQPQPPLKNRFTKPINKLENVITVSNPALVSLHDGLDVLMYHGVSFDGMIEQIPSLRNGYKQPDSVAKALLKRRHLSPLYGMDIAAEMTDGLIIDTVPDIFHSGHVHVNANSIYRGVRIINSGCWQSQTSFQKMMGHIPTPCRVPILDFQSNRMTTLNFI